MKKFKDYIGEAFFKVKIPDVAPTFVEAGSAGQVKQSMRKGYSCCNEEDVS
mgnify:CR=1 FL=1